LSREPNCLELPGKEKGEQLNSSKKIKWSWDENKEREWDLGEDATHKCLQPSRAEQRAASRGYFLLLKDPSPSSCS